MVTIQGTYNTAVCYTPALEDAARAQIQAVCDRPEFAGCKIRKETPYGCEGVVLCGHAKAHFLRPVIHIPRLQKFHLLYHHKFIPRCNELPIS